MVLGEARRHGSHFEWRMPVDDENTLSVTWFFLRVPKRREPREFRHHFGQPPEVRRAFVAAMGVAGA